VPVIDLPYGSDQIRVTVPDADGSRPLTFVDVISPRSVTPIEDEDAAIKRALDAPIGSPRLGELIRPGQRVAVVVDDYTRPTPVARILPHMLARLHGAGVSEEQITIVFALGTHRAMRDGEIVDKIGAGPASRYRLVNSSVHDDPAYVYMGTSGMGIPVWMLREVAEADLRIGIGSIVPHCDVGYAGGGKILLPGVCSAKTVAVNHTKGLDFHGRNLLGAATTIIREDLEDVVSRVGLGFVANTITTSDGRLYGLVCGHFITAHRAGVPFAQEVYGVPTRQRVDITICGSHPGDADFIQVAKSVWSGDKMTRPGGDLVVVTPCYEGIGPYSTLPALMAQDRHGLERRLRSGEILADTTGVMAALAVRLNRIGERVRIRRVSDGLSASVAGEMGLAHHETVEEALAAALERQGGRLPSGRWASSRPPAKVSVMTHGGYTYPMVEGES